ncbi:hypothetical protein EJK17_00520 [Lactobacillus xujianguonis]|uniref:Uncharacterized protein n=1 Tax=Lactobacillus xujianguonis TaxID=2495899 RepID=A0A437SXY4_9LACO|nr:hypothetical protein [Lactobacillus xujianguonis]RVU71794.1 hypothetical protein EJK17_00520 [Lactobacillus xujianguonis]
MAINTEIAEGNLKFARAIKSLDWNAVLHGGNGVDILIDASTYDVLKDYANRVNEPMSMVATRAIIKYIDMSENDGND